MLSREDAFALFEAHAKVTPCKMCQAAHEAGTYFITCPCGWSLANAEIATGSPDTDVVAIETIDKLELEGWAFAEAVMSKAGRISHGTPPIEYIDRVAQVSFGTLNGDKLFIMLFNANGFIRGKMVTERTVDSLKAKMVELCADMRSLSDFDVDESVAEACAKIEAKSA